MTDKEKFFKAAKNQNAEVETTRVRFPYQHSEDNAYYLYHPEKDNIRLYCFFRDDGKLLDKQVENFTKRG